MSSEPERPPSTPRLTFSIWNTSHNVGGGLAGIITAWAVLKFGGWQYAFYVPGAIALIGSVYLLTRLRDTPQSVEEACHSSMSVEADPPRRVTCQFGRLGMPA